MSFVHTIVFKLIMKSKVLYSPDCKIDYEKKRQEERRQTERIPLLKNVAVKESRMAGIPVELVTAEENPQNELIFYIHGGGFVLGEAKTRRFFTAYLAGKLHYNVVAVNYRLAPEFPYPAGAMDCLAVYEALLNRYDAGKIMFVGESAGGNLVLSTLLRAKEKNLPLPAAVFAFSPTVQYSKAFPSYTGNLNTDCMVGYLSEEVCDLYLQSRDKALLKNPFVAPYYGDYTGCPPIFLWASNSEVLRDDSIFFYKKLKSCGQDCELYLRDNMMHQYITTPSFPEAKKDLKIVKQRMDEVMNGKTEFGNRCVILK